MGLASRTTQHDRIFDSRRLHSFTCWLFVLVLGFTFASGCKSQKEKAAKESTSSAQEDDDTSPEDKKFIAASKDFLNALASDKPEAAYEQLSSHAKKKMSDFQFAVHDDDNKPHKSVQFTDVSAEKFASMFHQFAKPYGTPAKLRHCYVTTSKADELGEAKTTEAKIDRMLNLGNISADVPVGIRKAALRAQIITGEARKKHKHKRREQKADDEEEADEDESPYFSVKFVLVEEDGKLKVGYFEFLGPSILD